MDVELRIFKLKNTLDFVEYKFVDLYPFVDATSITIFDEMLCVFRMKSKEYYEKYGEKNVILEMFSDIDYNVIIEMLEKGY